MVTIVNASKSSLVAGRARRLARPWDDISSLLNHPELYPGEGVVVEKPLLRSGGAVGTKFLRYPIDIAYVDAGGMVVDIAKGVRPFARLALPSGAVRLVKLPAGALAGSLTAIGDRLDFIDDAHGPASKMGR